MSNCLGSHSPEVEDELVSLYSTLVDEDSFTIENDDIVPEENFLKDVENKLKETGDNTLESLHMLDQVKNKILDKVRSKKLSRQRRESTGSACSLGSTSMKRINEDPAGGDQSRHKMEAKSALPKLISCSK